MRLAANAGTANTIDYGYDSAGRMNQVATKMPGISNKTVNYVLDANGNRTKFTWPDGYYVGYCYDSLNRMAQAMENSVSLGCATNLLANYQYDALSRRTNLTYAGTGAQVQTPDPASYSAAGDLLNVAHVFQGGTSNNNVFTYSYTPAHQTLTAAATNAAWLWQPTTNNSTSYTVNNLNQYPTVGSQTTGGTNCQGATQGLSYNCNGNLTFDGTYTFTYDAENRLLTASKTGLSASYSYDPVGRRTQKSGTGVTQTFYLSDGTDEIAEYDTSSNVINRYVPGPTIDELVARVTGTGTKTFFHTDKQGSVVAMSDTTGAMAEGPYTYDPYGNCMSGGSSCSTAAIAYRFTGQRFDTETGCYYYRTRYYCPDDKRGGRFLQTDLVGYTADLNLHTYVGNDPTNRTDPSGSCDRIICKSDIGDIEGINVTYSGIGSTADMIFTPDIGSLGGAVRNPVTGLTSTSASYDPQAGVGSIGMQQDRLIQLAGGPEDEKFSPFASTEEAEDTAFNNYSFSDEQEQVIARLRANSKPNGFTSRPFSGGTVVNRTIRGTYSDAEKYFNDLKLTDVRTKVYAGRGTVTYGYGGNGSWVIVRPFSGKSFLEVSYVTLEFHSAGIFILFRFVP